MCWSPSSSLNLAGSMALRSPLRFGEWNRDNVICSGCSISAGRSIFLEFLSPLEPRQWSSNMCTFKSDDLLIALMSCCTLKNCQPYYCHKYDFMCGAYMNCFAVVYEIHVLKSCRSCGVWLQSNLPSQTQEFHFPDIEKKILYVSWLCLHFPSEDKNSKFFIQQKGKIEIKTNRNKATTLPILSWGWMPRFHQ